jgi:hypothetical protein
MRKAPSYTIALAVALTSYAPHRVQPLANDAYVWQRRWNGLVIQAIGEAAPSIEAWRVLAAECGADGNWLPIAVNLDSLRQTGKPAIAVIRINKLQDKFADQAAAVIGAWRKQGLALRGIEIDFDSGTDALLRYRDFLRLLRSRMDKRDLLSITALPSWLGSPDLPALLAAADESVLQVHSVMSPRQGLFDRTVARQWADKWSAQTSAPFLIALPTYWSRVSWNQAGRVVAIESEAARRGSDDTSQELFVDPADVSSFVTDLRRNPPAHLQGIAWFRLPTSQDERAWDAQTWHSVMAGKTIPPARPVVRIQNNGNGASNLYLVNPGGLTGRMPERLLVSAQACESADAMPPYKLEWSQSGMRFLLTQQNVLRGHQSRLVGWVRCGGKDGITSVSF